MIWLPILLVIGGAWATLIEPNLIQEESVGIKLDGLSAQAKELTIVQISDLHFQKFGFKEKKLIEKLKRLSPDYLFITGDLVDWTTEDLAGAQSFLEKISDISPNKTFSVQGNHEHRHPRLLQVQKMIQQAGIRMLENESVLLEEDVYLIGVDDPHWEFDDLDKAFQGVDFTKPKILLAHSPEIFRKINIKNILVLTGHTHGGQANIPFLVNILLPLKYDRQYKSGLFNQESAQLYVNRGIGTTFLPARINAFPEITIIKLQ